MSVRASVTISAIGPVFAPSNVRSFGVLTSVVEHGSRVKSLENINFFTFDGQGGRHTRDGGSAVGLQVSVSTRTTSTAVREVAAATSVVSFGVEADVVEHQSWLEVGALVDLALNDDFVREAVVVAGERLGVDGHGRNSVDTVVLDMSEAARLALGALGEVLAATSSLRIDVFAKVIEESVGLQILDANDDVVDQNGGGEVLVLVGDVGARLLFAFDGGLESLELDGLQVSEGAVLAATAEGEGHATTSSGRSGVLVEVVEQVVGFEVVDRHVVSIDKNVRGKTFVSEKTARRRILFIVIVIILAIRLSSLGTLFGGGSVVVIVVGRGRSASTTSDERVHASSLQVSEGAIFTHGAGGELGARLGGSLVRVLEKVLEETVGFEFVDGAVVTIDGENFGKVGIR